MSSFVPSDPGPVPLSREEIAHWQSLPADQQPRWVDGAKLQAVTSELARAPGLVTYDEVRTLRRLLAEAANGRRQIAQAGDCAEDPAECVSERLRPKVELLHSIAGRMEANARRPVTRVGRLAGQFAKPRSRRTQRYRDMELPSFQGLNVNGVEPDPISRGPDARRLLACHGAAATAMAFLRTYGRAGPAPAVWASHEALLLDYELAMLRRHDDGAIVLTSTHWPWIGVRTCQPDGAHVALLAAVSNPVACKVGPAATAADLLAVCRRLDPRREPGRLTLIARHGADLVATSLPPLVAAVRDAGHPVIWLCDPMHANTVDVPGAGKTRFVDAIAREVTAFQAAVAGAGGVAGGLHLEATPAPVTECVADASELELVGRRYTSLCDPRLNARQALEIAGIWGREPAGGGDHG